MKPEITKALTTYTNLGWKFVPLEGKAPKIKSWPKKTFTPKDFKEHHNVGLVLGPRSGGLVATDYDSPASRFLADSDIMPPTWADGRGGQISHHYYNCGESVGKKKQFKIIEPNALAAIGMAQSDTVVIVEVLAAGQQVMTSPSIHPDTGEEICWNVPGHLRDAGPNKQDYSNVVKMPASSLSLQSSAWLGPQPLASVMMLPWPSQGRFSPQASTVVVPTISSRQP